MKEKIRKGLRSIIAIREFVRRVGRRSTPVRIEIGSPVHLPANAKRDLSDWWACPLRIRGVGKPMELYVGGSDSFQAVELAMRLAAQRILDKSAFQDGELYWGNTPMRNALDLALPLGPGSLQLALDITRGLLRKSKLPRPVLRSFSRNLNEIAKHLAACARMKP
jgi:hypothetical protein